jgi:hypothetical protein
MADQDYSRASCLAVKRTRQIPTNRVPAACATSGGDRRRFWSRPVGEPWTEAAEGRRSNLSHGARQIPPESGAMPFEETGKLHSLHPACGHLLPSAEKESRRGKPLPRSNAQIISEFMIFCRCGKGFWLPTGSSARILPFCSCHTSESLSFGRRKQDKVAPRAPHCNGSHSPAAGSAYFRPIRVCRVGGGGWQADWLELRICASKLKPRVSGGGKELPSRGQTCWEVTVSMQTISASAAGCQSWEKTVRRASVSSAGDSERFLTDRRQPEGGILARLCAAIRFHVPVGYEDETGFHYGTQCRKETASDRG